MSEYQYYEFLSLDRPLSASAQAEMKDLSSRVQLTASSASFVYNYSDFPDDPYKVLVKHFDVMLYISNWGTRQLMFRFPADAIPTAVRETYQYAQVIEWSTKDEYVILEIRQDDEDGFGWVEGEGLLSGIAQVRDDILHGDYRSLYLAWLMAVMQELYGLEDDEDLTEPPVPAGLQTLSPTLHNIIDFFEIDIDLVSASAQQSPQDGQEQASLTDYLDKLDEDEMRDYLKRLLASERYLDIALTKRLRELAGIDDAVSSENDQPRTIRQLMEIAKQVEKERLAKERQQKEAARKQHLEEVAQVEDTYWERVPLLIALKQANAYDEAVNLLKDLHDLAEQRGQLPDFKAKMLDFQDKYPTLRGFHRRLEDAGLF